jgi:hypothetical protein
MFSALLIAAAVIAVLGIVVALDGSRDVFHPLVFICPMFLFLYVWMPWKLNSADGLLRYFDMDQLLFVQRLNVIGIAAVVIAAFAAGLRLPRTTAKVQTLSPLACRRLLIGAAITGSIGCLCWGISIHNVGGFVHAYSASYAGGWDDSGYVRDGSLLMLVGILLAICARSAGAPLQPSALLIGIFTVPWLSQALLAARRGPTFAWVIIVLMGWYINRGKRPPIVAAGIVGICLGWGVMFLVTNRSNIYLGSSFDVTTDVSAIADKPDTGNEYIYGTASVIAALHSNHYFWMRRYLAQILVRPIPSAIWPTKHEDFGVPELLQNAGTGAGITETMGWVGAPGSAPGIVADLWIELWWLSIAALALIGWTYTVVWRKAVTLGGAWASQYTVLSALSIYLVMQTMEAVIFRTLLLSIPCWITWRWALQAPAAAAAPVSRATLLRSHGAKHA